MSDDNGVENHTIRLLQEMRAEIRSDISSVRTEVAQFRQETGRRLSSLESSVGSLESGVASLASGVGSLDRRMSVLEPAVVKVIDAVTAIANTQEQHTALLMTHSEKLTEIQRAQNVMEKDMRGIRGRVERIEDHIGLVKA
jgi:chromosome segregation ATPase